MSAGSGVQHSEFNPSPTQAVHFLQIWIQPAVLGVTPSYEQVHVAPAAKRGMLAAIAGPQGAGAAVTIHQDARIFAALVDADETIEYRIPAGRRAYVHVARGSLSINATPLGPGDAAVPDAEEVLRLAQGHQAEVLVFDLP